MWNFSDGFRGDSQAKGAYPVRNLVQDMRHRYRPEIKWLQLEDCGYHPFAIREAKAEVLFRLGRWGNL